MAKTLGVKLGEFLQRTSKSVTPKYETFYWSDFTALYCLVEITKISETVREEQLVLFKNRKVTFSYIPYINNPADLATKPNKKLAADSKLWWYSPDLSLLQSIQTVTTNTCETEISCSSFTSVAFERQSDDLIDFKRFSVLRRLVRTQSYVKRFISKFKKQNCSS